MTDARRPDLPGRDPALDAAWRGYSVESPPPALDAAILAAAHREAKAQPRALGDDDALAEAREPSKWWWGLAAAATIGAIAFGLVQLAPPPPGEPTAASDMPASAPSRVADAPTAAPAPASPAAPMPRSPPVAERGAPAPAIAAPPPVPARAPSSDAQNAVSPRRESAEPPVPLAKREEPPPKSRDGPVASAPPPFPAAPADAARAQKTPQQEFERKQALTLERPAAPGAAVEEAPARTATVAPPPTRPRRADEGRQQALGAAAEATQPTPANEFVARIEAALAASRADDAVRELNAFRAAYPDADERLPAALRQWAATVPPAAAKPR